MSTCSRARKTSVPNTRRIGWAKLPAVYCVAGLGIGKAAIPGRRAAHGARGEAVDGEGRERAPTAAMKTKTSRPL